MKLKSVILSENARFQLTGADSSTAGDDGCPTASTFDSTVRGNKVRTLGVGVHAASIVRGEHKLALQSIDAVLREYASAPIGRSCLLFLKNALEHGCTYVLCAVLGRTDVAVYPW